MSDAWAAVIAAVAAGVFGIAGAFAGLFVGHRQTAGEAHVEHRQWLRDQRQQAYLQLYNAWDAAIKDLRAYQFEWPDRADRVLEEQSRFGGGKELRLIAQEECDEVWARLLPAVDRTELLGRF
ncbi:hypothetical protein J8N05_19470 [Streptomyces sp. BH-SS-21]|uniref:Uncharacterized protein n=1 Tax=Streptomyces liliiviolaceus TaxID=2823109 RepID=A0A940XQX8_9ACTN|nr:hypothetical protein [Streptomyces liliiviolaceus]MBQ0850369.1 hypothetical protein [Streptomyces liliiviolaceus]